MILDDVGQKADVPYLGLGVEAAFFVIIRRDLLHVVPALVAFPENGLVEVEHAGEIAVVPDEIRNLFGLFVKDLAYGEGVVFFEGAVTHFS